MVVVIRRTMSGDVGYQSFKIVQVMKVVVMKWDLLRTSVYRHVLVGLLFCFLFNLCRTTWDSPGLCLYRVKFICRRIDRPALLETMGELSVTIFGSTPFEWTTILSNFIQDWTWKNNKDFPNTYTVITFTDWEITNWFIVFV